MSGTRSSSPSSATPRGSPCLVLCDVQRQCLQIWGILISCRYSKLVIDFDVISRLTEVLKDSSPSLEAKVATVMEHLAVSEQHATAMTAACTGSIIEAVLEMGAIHVFLFIRYIYLKKAYVAAADSSRAIRKTESLTR